jgi:hypothetical protein
MGIKSKQEGNKGETEVVKKVPCPNCGSKLMKLPVSYPLFDVQCTKCLFRAQIKTNNCKPKDQIFGAGWDIMDKNLRTGQLIPPLIVNFKWKEGQKQKRTVLFFPFLTKKNLRAKTRSQNGSRPGYREFNYIGLMSDNIAKIVLKEE